MGKKAIGIYTGVQVRAEELSRLSPDQRAAFCNGLAKLLSYGWVTRENTPIHKDRGNAVRYPAIPSPQSVTNGKPAP